MALHVPKAPGIAQMLKEGARYFVGVEEAVYRNIQACKLFAQTVRTAYGPNGMNKIVINHIEKLFITNDAATIISELEVEHPAVKLMVFASKMQEAEVGDGTNFVIIFAGALLDAAEELLRLGINVSEIVEGYEAALEKALTIMQSSVCCTVEDIKNDSLIQQGVRTSIMSKQFGNEDILTALVMKACSSILTEDTTFNVDNVRVCKILGSGLASSEVVQGMVFKRQVEGNVTKKENAKIAVYTCAVDIMQTETKGTVLIKSADELLKFSQGEENLLESQIKAIANSGATVVVSGGKFGDMALHYMDVYNLMAVRIPSKFDLRRLCKSVGATALPRLVAPTKDELGFADVVHIDEIGDTIVVKFTIESKENRISTVVVRGSTENYMDDIERAIDDGVNTFKGISRSRKFVPGAGAIEIEMALELAEYANKISGLQQYAVRKFATALEVFPKTLAENSGSNASQLLSELYAAHKGGKNTSGIVINENGTELTDAYEAQILDLLLTKEWAMKYAVDVACTVLKIDHIIMAKRAGGPKVPGGVRNDED